jgi:hypothetical protein
MSSLPYNRNLQPNTQVRNGTPNTPGLVVTTFDESSGKTTNVALVKLIQRVSTAVVRSLVPLYNGVPDTSPDSVQGVSPMLQNETISNNQATNDMGSGNTGSVVVINNAVTDGSSSPPLETVINFQSTSTASFWNTAVATPTAFDMSISGTTVRLVNQTGTPVCLSTQLFDPVNDSGLSPVFVPYFADVGADIAIFGENSEGYSLTSCYITAQKIGVDAMGRVIYAAQVFNTYVAPPV